MMTIIRFVCAVAMAAMLAACATTEPPAPMTPTPPPSLASLLHDADLALQGGHHEQAVTILTTATTLYPRDPAPFLKIAQVQFECHRYGEAITHAQQVLAREPDHLIAHSLVAVSGLRVSSKALADLATQNKLTGSVRAEAQDLARLLRASIGGDIIVPQTK